MLKLFNKIISKMKEYGQDGITISISAVPDGPDDYRFANLCMEYEDGELKTTICRF